MIDPRRGRSRMTGLVPGPDDETDKDRCRGDTEPDDFRINIDAADITGINPSERALP